MNEVKKVIKKPKLGKGVVKGSLSTIHDQKITIYADGSVFIDDSEGNQVWWCYCFDSSWHIYEITHC